MYIKNIEIKDFRNYESLLLQFNKNVNLILGKNAQGKTNLLESIYISSIGKSFRTNKDSEMIRFGCDGFFIKVEDVKNDFDGSVEINVSGDLKKNIKVNGVKIKKLSELLENIYIVIFSPEDLKIVKDEPEKRRKFIDKELCQIKPSYYSNLVNYKKILAERNIYLKDNYIDDELLDIWDLQLAKYGAEIIRERKIFLEKINNISSKIHNNITNGKEYLRIEYDPNIKIKDKEEINSLLLETIRASRENDKRLRTTTRGPHKDDIIFYIDEINVRSFGSQGQQRTTALALKLAEIDIIKKETGEDPILLLDDVMSELDLERQEFLVKTLFNNQLFVTTTEMPEIILNKFPDASIYYVENGIITKKP